MVDVNRSFEFSENGISLISASGQIIWLGAGDDDPTVTSISAPIGSKYYRIGGLSYEKTGPLDTDWKISGLGSDVISGGVEHGKLGVVNTNQFLERVGRVPTNIVGTPINKADATIRGVIVQNELSQNFSIEIIQHTGKLANATVLYTASITDSSGKITVSGLSIPITQGYQLASKVSSGSCKSVGINIDIKGTA